MQGNTPHLGNRGVTHAEARPFRDTPFSPLVAVPSQGVTIELPCRGDARSHYHNNLNLGTRTSLLAIPLERESLPPRPPGTKAGGRFALGTVLICALDTHVHTHILRCVAATTSPSPPPHCSFDKPHKSSTDRSIIVLRSSYCTETKHIRSKFLRVAA